MKNPYGFERAIGRIDVDRLIATDYVPAANTERWMTIGASIVPAAGVPNPEPSWRREPLLPERFVVREQVPIVSLHPKALGATVGYVEHFETTAADGLSVAGRVMSRGEIRAGHRARWYDLPLQSGDWWVTAEYALDGTDAVLTGLVLTSDRREPWSVRARVLPFDTAREGPAPEAWGGLWRRARTSMLGSLVSRAAEGRARPRIVDGDATPPPPPDDKPAKRSTVELRHQFDRSRLTPDNTVTLLGIITTPEGIYLHRDGTGRMAAGWAKPGYYDPQQPDRIPVWFEHLPRQAVGQVELIARGPTLGVAVVARCLADQIVPILRGEDWYFSPGESGRGGLIEGQEHFLVDRINEVSLVRNPANVAPSPIEWIEFDVEQSRPSSRPRPERYWRLWDLAAEACQRWDHHTRSTTPIVDLDPPAPPAGSLDDALAHVDRRLAEAAPNRARPAARALLVRSFPADLEMSEGQLFGRLVPFDVSARVADPRPDGTWDRYSEGFRRGAFAGQTGGAVAGVDLRHKHGGAGLGYLGPATSLEEHTDGLHGEFKVISTRRADVADLLANGVTGLSIEFRERPGGTIERDGVRWRTNVHLDAVALEHRGAYADAGVTSYRSRTA
ncbi:hypothetical protein [Desertimonas flava]|uniref:hypothetical protein n=1 Tax=Desertimonas flava TaxID=2064846 RepID=UPI000E3450B6|nr:hypothetical protein [Desertimonas flava]